MKDFVAINISEYFKSNSEKLYPKPSQEKKKKVDESLYICLTTPDEVEKYVELCITKILRFWIFLIKNYNWLTLNQWLK